MQSEVKRWNGYKPPKNTVLICIPLGKPKVERPLKVWELLNKMVTLLSCWNLQSMNCEIQTTAWQNYLPYENWPPHKPSREEIQNQAWWCMQQS